MDAELAARPVDAKAAQTRREKDKATIDGFVDAMPGGFETRNATITEASNKAAAVIAGRRSLSEAHADHARLLERDIVRPARRRLQIQEAIGWLVRRRLYEHRAVRTILRWGFTRPWLEVSKALHG